MPPMSRLDPRAILTADRFIPPGRRKGVMSKATLAMGDHLLLERTAKTAELALLTVAPELPPAIVEPLSAIFDTGEIFSDGIGAHPDFADLKPGQGFRHDAITMFVDVERSTHLGVIWRPEEVHFLKNAVLRLAIQVIQVFGGHIHRLQGDGVVALFVRKHGDPEEMLVRALDASSTLQWLVDRHLNPNIIQANDLDPLKVRVGIDYGPESETLWARYGFPGCDELTLTGLHVDLAAKLQSSAPAGGVMVGDNVRKILNLEDAFLSVRTFVENGNTVEDAEFRFQPAGKDYRYKKWVFDWHTWIEHLDAMEEFGCTIHANYGRSEHGPFHFPYRPGMGLQKGHFIEFSFTPPPSMHITKAEWWVVNQGPEAIKAQAKMHKRAGDRIVRGLAYTGLHHMLLRLYSDASVVGQASMPVRVY